MKFKQTGSPLTLSVTAIVDSTGRSGLQTLRYLLELLAFTWSSLLSLRLRNGAHLQRRPIVSQIIFSGVDALPTIGIISLAIAFSVTAQFILLLQDFTTEKEVIRIITLIVVQELAPLLTAIILIGRSGAAIAVDLGNMRLNREILGLELLGIDIQRFFVLPRILGLAISQFSLAVFFSTLVMVPGIIFSALLDSPANYNYLIILTDSITPYELLIFMLKNLLFGLMIGSIACFHGLRTEHSVTELPQQTQQTVVNSLIFIFILDGLVAVLS